MAIISLTGSIANQSTPSGRHFALWQMGFRPFYLLASVFAALSIPLWIAQYAGFLATPYVGGALWHGYEMLFGYVSAVIAGFLLTAVRTWSGQPTPTGLPLIALAALWLAGRILILTPHPLAALVVNVAFPLAVGIAVAVPLILARNRRNYFVIGLLICLAMAGLLFELADRGALNWSAPASLQIGFDLVLFLVAVIAGRVVPMFTNNGIPGAKASRHPAIEKIALTGLIAILLLDLLQPAPRWVALAAVVTAIAHAARLWLWQPWLTWRTPLVWILHAAYAWVVVYLLLRSLAGFGLVPPSLALHALTIGAIGSMTIGMMIRTSRGHTGRTLDSGRLEGCCFVLIQCAVISRVGGGMLFPGHYVASVIAAGVCWSAAFALFAIGYLPVLWWSRIDGKPG